MTVSDAVILLGYGHPGQRGRHFPQADRDAIAKLIIELSGKVGELESWRIHMNAATMPVTESSRSGFYPTPPTLSEQMLKGIDWRTISTILEPSAGKGDLVDAIVHAKVGDGLWDRTSEEYIRSCYKGVDCVEIDPNLRHILTGKGLRVIHDDFLNFDTYKKYDLIVMNPPFSQGDKHLLHAIHLQQRHGGAIVCLLNAETIKNQFSHQRQMLAAKLEQLGAEIEYVQNGFDDAERKTDVEVAIVKVLVPAESKPNIILDELRKDAPAADDDSEYEARALSNGDFVQAIIDQYNFEVRAGVRMIELCEEMQPYILEDGKANGKNAVPIMRLYIGGDHTDRPNRASILGYIQRVRMKYWQALFQDTRFTKQLTTNLVEDLRGKVEELKDYDFTLFNILTLRQEMTQKLVGGIEQTILKLFEDWTYKYHYGEYTKNRYMFDGWKTNCAYKVNSRVIFPLHGINPFDGWSGYFDPNGYRLRELLGDIEKTFDYLDSGQTPSVDMKAALEDAKRTGQTKKIPLKYFTVTFYKKGTCHVEFTNIDVLHKFNLFGCQRKGWLPPSYGKKRYKDMTESERSVVDSFEGEASYRRVMDRAEYYLVEPGQLLLEVGA